MTPERWNQVKCVLQEALEIAPEQRPAFLDRACSTDHSLRREVESLLSSSNEVRSSFMKCSADAALRLTKGTRLGDFEIVSLIGAGGMGEVYRARDCRLERDVAIKVLPRFVSFDPERLHRFEQEAKAAAVLNHPNILAVFQMGTYEGAPYLVSELLEGETLREQVKRGPIPPKRAIDYALQIAHGLAAAHGKGIVHRDLKPENLFIARDSRIKILDFGLAKLTHAESETQVTKQTLDTEPGAVLGTVGYMSPEQVRGQAADHRSDIFAFGAILYEMLSGKRAFQGETTADTMSAILNKEPKAISKIAPSISRALGQIVYRCLEKDPANRYESARELISLLEESATTSAGLQSRSISRKMRYTLAVGFFALLLLVSVFRFNFSGWRDRLRLGTGSTQIDSLAVLPLANLSADPHEDYFVDGMTDELTTSLAQIGHLRVISRTSAMQFKDTKKPLQQIAKELNVQAVVEGSVMRSGDRVRITAQLIEAPSDRHLWAKRYERDLKDVLALQDEVARDIAKEIRIKLTPQERVRLPVARPVDPEAHEAYLQGRHYWDKMSVEGFSQAIKRFQQAIIHDPDYALAYAGLSDGYQELSIWGAMQPTEAGPKSAAAAEKALSIDDSLAPAHAALGNVRFLYDWKWNDAAQEFQRALELDPNYAPTHIEYAVYLAAMGRPNDAMAEAREAHKLDPVSQTTNGLEAYVYFLNRRFDQAISQLQNAIALYPDAAFNHSVLAACYEQKHMYPEAFDEYLKAAAIAGLSSEALVERRHAFAAYGFDGYLQQELQSQTSESKRLHPYVRAELYARLGQTDRALQWLERAYRDRGHNIAFLKVIPQMDRLRSDSRFQGLLRRIAFPE